MEQLCNRLFVHAAIWMSMENMIPSEEIRHKMPHIVWVHFYEISRIGKFIETESHCQGDELGCLECEVSLNEQGIFWGVKILWN